MSSNTNTLFWVITGAVIVLGVFALINTSQNDTLSKVDNEFSELYNNAKAGPELIKYYNHEPNYGSLKITDESLFDFDETTGTITGYKGTERNVVFPATINGVEVKKIGNMNLWNNSLYYEECLTFINEDPNDFFVQERLRMLEDEGILVDGVCQERVLLDSVVIPNTVKEIGSCAFCYNQNLKKVTLPNSIEKISVQAFYENQLESIDLSNLDKLNYISTLAFANNNISGEVIIPDSVNKVESNAFSDNNITSAIISKNIEEFSLYTFKKNPNMISLMFKNDSMKIRDSLDIDDLNVNDFAIYVPVGSKSWYQGFSSLANYNILEKNYE